MKKESKFFDKPENIKKMLWGFYASLVALVLIDILFVHHEHSYFPWDGKPGFFAAFGFVACVLVILISKVLRFFLIRGNDYYGED